MASRRLHIALVMATVAPARAARADDASEQAQPKPPGPTLRAGGFAVLGSLQLGTSKGGKAFEPI